MNFVKFEVTGVNSCGIRLKKKTFYNFAAASMVNLYTGSVWGILENGKRKLLKRVYN